MYKRFVSIFVDDVSTEKKLETYGGLLRSLYWLLVIAIGAAAILLFVNLIGHIYFSKDGQWGTRLGTFGDFFGGLVNPMLTFLTFFGLIVTIVMQKMELRLARDEYQETSSALKTQAIETTFFNTVGLHHKIIEDLKFNAYESMEKAPENRTLLLSGLISLSKDTVKGRDVFGAVIKSLKHGAIAPDEVIARYKYLQNKSNHVLGHYFRNLYQALKMIDSYSEEHLGKDDKQKYASILRAQLSSQELTLLFLNCLEGMVDLGQFRNLLVKYKMLEHAQLYNHGGIIKDVYFQISVANMQAVEWYRKEGEIQDVPERNDIDSAFGKASTRIFK